MGKTILSPSNMFGNLPLLKIITKIRIKEKKFLPYYLGSAWRGLIGWEMKRLVCPFDRNIKCNTCTIKKHCPYYLLFEDKTLLPGLGESPRGYIFYPLISDENMHEVHMTLVGSCSRFLPVLIKAMFKGQKSGLGASRSEYEIISLEQVIPGNANFPMTLEPELSFTEIRSQSLAEWLQSSKCKEATFNLRIFTPVRLRKKGRYLNPIEWPFFFETAVRRLESLNCMFNGGEQMGRVLWKQVQDYFADITYPDANLRWLDYSRYSNRQQRKVPMGGMVGKVVAENLSPQIQDWWKAISLIHVGKGASMGLGKVEIIRSHSS